MSTITHTYSTNGSYMVNLTLSEPSVPGGCSSTYTMSIAISNALNPCGLSTSFLYTLSPGGNVLFNNTSTGGPATTTYAWNFGDGTTQTTTQGQTLFNHQYLASGIYMVTVIANNNAVPTCTSSQTQFLVIPCQLTAALLHTVGASGQVSFQSASTGTNPATNYFWDFGDGVYTGGSSPSHTYLNAGAYTVVLRISGDTLCRDSVVQSVNVTGVACAANSNFVLNPSGTPQYWNATPTYPWNVTSASWDWGDGMVSNQLYTSHAYSVAGSYNICLSVTLSCGATGSTCSSYSVFRSQQEAQDMAMIYVNVTRPSLSTALASAEAEPISSLIYPNPNNGEFSLKLNGPVNGSLSIGIYSLVGELVYEKEIRNADSGHMETIQLGDKGSGIYFIKLRSGTQAVTKKVIVH